MHTRTNLAWALIEAVKPQLKAVERNHVFVILDAGDTFIAIRLLLKPVAAKQILLRPHLVQQCSTWLDAMLCTRSKRIFVASSRAA